MATIPNKDNTARSLSDEDSQNPSVNPMIKNQSDPTQNNLIPLNTHNPQNEPSSHPIAIQPLPPPTHTNDTHNTETPDTQSVNSSDSPPNPCNNTPTQVSQSKLTIHTQTQHDTDVVMKDLSNPEPNHPNSPQSDSVQLRSTSTCLHKSKFEDDESNQDDDESESEEIDGYIVPDTDTKSTHKRKLAEIGTERDSKPPTKKARRNDTNSARDIINIVAALHTKNAKAKNKTKIMWNSPASKRIVDSDTNDEDEEENGSINSKKRNKIRPKKQLSKQSKAKRKGKKHKKKHKKSSKSGKTAKIIIKVPKKERIPRLHAPTFKPTAPRIANDNVNNASPSTTSTNEDRGSNKSAQKVRYSSSYERERENRRHRDRERSYKYKYREERERERERDNDNLTGLWIQDDEVKFILYEDFKSGQIIGFMQFKQRTECTINGIRKENNYYDITQIFIHDRKHINQIAKLCEDYRTIELNQVESNKNWTLKLESKRYPDDLFHELEQLKKAQQYGPYRYDRYETRNAHGHGHGVSFGHPVGAYPHGPPPPYMPHAYPTSFIAPYTAPHPHATHPSPHHIAHFAPYINGAPLLPSRHPMFANGAQAAIATSTDHIGTDKALNGSKTLNNVTPDKPQYEQHANNTCTEHRNSAKKQQSTEEMAGSKVEKESAIAVETESTHIKEKKSVIAPPDISPFNSPLVSNASNVENECLIVGVVQQKERKAKKHRRARSSSSGKKKREKREREKRERRQREREKERERKEKKRKQREAKAMMRIFDAVSIEFRKYKEKYLSESKKYKSTVKKCSQRVQDRYKEKKSKYNVETATMFLESNRNQMYIEKLVKKYVKQKDKHDKDKHGKGQSNCNEDGDEDKDGNEVEDIKVVKEE